MATMSVGRTGLLVAAAFWCGFLVLLANAPESDRWVLGVEFLIVVLLSLTASWHWRGGQVADVPKRVIDWLTDESGPRSGRR
jgi:hypothetical protein